MKKRKVTFKKYVDRREDEAIVPKWVLEEAGEGDFLGWGVDYEELEGGPGPFSVGIIETGLGIIELVRADFIRFLTKGEEPLAIDLGLKEEVRLANSALSPSEALYGFMGWLTTRAVTVTLGAEHNCAGIPDLIGEYCKANELEDPRWGWHHQHKHPEKVQL
jgi:hypothetical protein